MDWLIRTRSLGFSSCYAAKIKKKARIEHRQISYYCLPASRQLSRRPLSRPILFSCSHTLFIRLEHGVYNLSRVREAAIKRYTAFQIPWVWMQETGFITQVHPPLKNL